MSKRTFIIYPLLLVLLVFAIDKVALIPAVERAGRTDPTPMENTMLSVRIAADYWKKEQKTPILLFGTSRTNVFHYISEENLATARMRSEKDRRALQGILPRLETRLIIKASELFITYNLLKRATEAGMKPEYAIVEISPEMFNYNSPFSYYNLLTGHVYTRSDLYDALSFSRGEIRSEILTRLLFPSYAIKFKTGRAFSNLLSGEDVMKKNAVVLYMLGTIPLVEPLGPDYQDFPDHTDPSPEYKKRFEDYTDYLMTRDIMRNYHYYDMEKGIITRIADYARDQGINILFWMPRVHPLLAAHWEESEFAAHKAEIVETVKGTGFPFFDGPNEEYYCNRWVDASHLSSKCAPSLLSDLLHRLGALPQGDPGSVGEN